MRADVAEYVDRLSAFRIVLNVEREDNLHRNVAFPDVGVSSHLADAKRGVKGSMFSALLEELKRLSDFSLDVGGEFSISLPECFQGAVASHWASRKSSIPSIESNVRN